MADVNMDPVNVAGQAAAGGSMLGPIGALAGGVIGAGAGLLGDIFQGQSSAANVQQQEQYETQMADTQYQRSVSDMKAAGLNPLAMFSAGSGMPSPTPNVQVAQPGQYSNMGSVLPNAVGSAISAQDQFYGLAQQQASIDNTDAQRRVNLANATKTLASLPGVGSANAVAAAEAQLSKIELGQDSSLYNAQESMGKPYWLTEAVKGNPVVGALGSAAGMGLGVVGQGLSQAGASGAADLVGAAAAGM